ncbi:MAG: ECF transporter S component [Oscillospiraceae bacterium]|jgi:uncharacterized membrane protein|nr:ECF transporter S component [Oscillospiraceae bacterium]
MHNTTPLGGQTSTAATPVHPRTAQRQKLLRLVQFAVLLALEALVCFTPLGSLPIGPVVATLSHIPVIFAAVLLGPLAGGGMGFAFGLFSFLVMSFQSPGVTSFLFTPLFPVPGADAGSPLSLLICFVPRILIGMTAGIVYKIWAERFPKVPAVCMGVAAIIGSLTNTLLVVGGIYFFFFDAVVDLFPFLGGTGFFAFLTGFVGVNGVLEVVAAVVLTVPVCLALRARPINN